MKTQDKLLDWAIEIQSLAQAGLTYGKDKFDLVRYERLRDISAEMIAERADISIEKVKELFCNESGYQTPKVDTRAAVFNGGKILLVHESDGTWSLPGGWCDVDCSVAENVVKETREEAGLTVKPELLIAVQDRCKHNKPNYAYGVIKHFVLCSLVVGEFVPNIETTGIGWFAEEELPDSLATAKNTREQISMCFRAIEAEHWVTQFD